MKKPPNRPGLRDCPTCGNPVSALQCPYCETWVEAAEPVAQPKRSVPAMVTINLEAGHPFVKEALARFEAAFDRALHQDARILEVIHGYGSSGKGGAIREAFRKRCDQLMTQGEIAYFVPGENSQLTSSGKQLVKQFPELANQGLFRISNPGNTWVVLKKR